MTRARVNGGLAATKQRQSALTHIVRAKSDAFDKLNLVGPDETRRQTRFELVKRMIND